MLIIAGSLAIEPGKRDEYLEHCRPIVARARSAVGCLDFSLSPDLLDPDRIVVYERWSAEEPLERFRSEPGPDAPTSWIVDAEVARYLIDEVAPA